MTLPFCTPSHHAFFFFFFFFKGFYSTINSQDSLPPLKAYLFPKGRNLCYIFYILLGILVVYVTSNDDNLGLEVISRRHILASR